MRRGAVLVGLGVMVADAGTRERSRSDGRVLAFLEAGVDGMLMAGADEVEDEEGERGRGWRD